MFGTYCGVKVDAQMRVHDVFGAPIDGLLAAGEMVGGLHGAAYMTGSALGKAAIFGRLAAATACNS
ncbi:Fumarate reductase flavoprotein subunit precursor [compost metagenome]